MASGLTEAELEKAVADALPSMLRMASRLAGDEDLAEEAVQDALLRVTRSWRTFRGDAALQTWLGRIVIHCVRDRITKSRRHASLGEADEPIDASDRGPAQHAMRSEQGARVRRAVQRLPDRQREVLSLVTWDGKTPADVAKLLDVSVQNVHANLHAARGRLRELLQDELKMESDS